MPFAIGYSDYVPKSVVSGGSFVTSLPLSNIKTDDIEEVARTASLDPADTQFQIDTGSIPAVGLIVIKVNNASPNLEYRIRSYPDAAMTALSFDTTQTQIESGTQVDWSDPNTWLAWEDANFWTGIVPSQYGELPFYIVVPIPAASASQGLVRYWDFKFFDESNINGYLDFGSVMLFRIFRPQYNYAPDSNSSDLMFLQSMEESDGGRRTYEEKAIRRAVRFSWPVISEAEAFDEFMRIGLLSRTSRRIFILPEENETGDRLRLRAFPATFTKSPSIAQIKVSRGSTSVDAEEVL